MITFIFSLCGVCFYVLYVVEVRKFRDYRKQMQRFQRIQQKYYEDQMLKLEIEYMTKNRRVL